MNTDVEELLRDGMQRFTAGLRAPAGLARTAGRLHRRRLAVRAAVACGTAAVTAAAVVVAAAGAGGTPPPSGVSGARVRTAAYVVHRVEKALAGTNLVFRGSTASTGQTSVNWAYGPRYRFEEFTGSGCGHALPSGECTHRGGSEPYLALGTAIIDGKLAYAYVSYYNHMYSLAPLRGSRPGSACSTHTALAMGSPVILTNHWSAFINATLACGAAKVTGHVWIDGVETTRITGSPVKVKLSTGYAKVVGEKWARARWTLYVNPQTYLPVRIYGSTQTFGGPRPSTRFTSVTDVQWLPPTKANKAKALVTIPAGFHQVSSSADH